MKNLFCAFNGNKDNFTDLIWLNFIKLQDKFCKSLVSDNTLRILTMVWFLPIGCGCSCLPRELQKDKPFSEKEICLKWGSTSDILLFKLLGPMFTRYHFRGGWGAWEKMISKKVICVHWPSAHSKIIDRGCCPVFGHFQNSATLQHLIAHLSKTGHDTLIRRWKKLIIPGENSFYQLVLMLTTFFLRIVDHELFDGSPQ